MFRCSVTATWVEACWLNVKVHNWSAMLSVWNIHTQIMTYSYLTQTRRRVSFIKPATQSSVSKHCHKSAASILLSQNWYFITSIMENKWYFLVKRVFWLWGIFTTAPSSQSTLDFNDDSLIWFFSDAWLIGKNTDDTAVNDKSSNNALNEETVDVLYSHPC